MHVTADVSDQQLRLMPPSFCNSATHRTFLVTRSDNPSRSTKYQKEVIVVSQKMKIGEEGSSTSTSMSTNTKIHHEIHVDQMGIFRQYPTLKTRSSIDMLGTSGLFAVDIV